MVFEILSSKLKLIEYRLGDNSTCSKANLHAQFEWSMEIELKQNRCLRNNEIIGLEYPSGIDWRIK